MYTRTMQAELLQVAQDYPVVSLMGARQSGKTTLVQATFASKPYVSLEDPDQRLLAQTDSRGLLNQLPDGAIIDEIQRVPSYSLTDRQ